MLCIYIIKNKINNGIYVGKSIKYKQRKYRHFYNLRNNRHENQHLQHSFNKYGEKNFEIKVLCECEDIDELNKKEIYYIDKYQKEDICYNMKSGGDGSYGYKHSEEAKKRISKAHKGKPIHPEVWKKELSKRMSGENNPAKRPEVRVKLSNANKGNNNSSKRPEVRKKISKSRNKLGLFGFTGVYYSMKKYKPWLRVWMSHITYNGFGTSLGVYNDPLSGQIVYKFVWNEIHQTQ